MKETIEELKKIGWSDDLIEAFLESSEQVVLVDSNSKIQVEIDETNKNIVKYLNTSSTLFL